MKNLLHAFAPLTVLSAACEGLYEDNLPAKEFVLHKQTKALQRTKKRPRTKGSAKQKN